MEMLHKSFIRRQLTGSKSQAAVFVLCVMLSIVTLVALNGFGESVHNSLLKDARTLHAGDIIIHSHYDFSQPLSEAVASLARRGAIESAKAYELYSVVRTVAESNSLLAKLKVVEKGYPFYGKVELLSGRAFDQVLTGGGIIVEQPLLDRLSLGVGDKMRIGEATLTIRDVVVREPDRPVSFFSLGPRVFVSSQDLDALDLVRKGSRIEHLEFIKVLGGRDVDRIAAELSASAQKEQERVDTFRTARSGIKKFFDNFLFYLSLISIFTLLLAGIAIQSTLTAFLREKEKTIAIMKTVGATSRFVTLQYVMVLLLLGMTGTVLGLLVGYSLLRYLPHLFKGLLPPNVEPVLSSSGVVQGLLLGTLVVAMFTFLPLHRLRDLKPTVIFHKEERQLKNGWPFYLVVSIILLFFLGMVLWQVEDLEVGLTFVGGVLLLILVTGFAAHLVLMALKKGRVKSLALRQALRGLFRPGNATRAIITTLAASLSVIFSITLIEQNLDAAFVRSYPADAPNLFFIDIQPGQKDDFSRTLDLKAEYHPVVRARISFINGRPIDPGEEERKRGDNMAREFNLTYRSHLLDDESILKGNGLFRDDWGAGQVSVLDTVTEMADMKIGDVIAFNIQGVPLEARVSSIRARTKEPLRPFFYFVMPEEALKDAPQTLFTAVRVARERIGPLQNETAARFPNVSTIDITETLSVFAQVMHKLSMITRFVALFSIVAGVLIIVSSVLATRFARIQEAVYFRMLGARSRFILLVFTFESTIIGLISAALALAVSQAGCYVVNEKLLDIPYQPFIGRSMLMVAGTVSLVIILGLLSSLSVLTTKPAVFLREQTEE